MLCVNININVSAALEERLIIAKGHYKNQENGTMTMRYLPLNK